MTWVDNIDKSLDTLTVHIKALKKKAEELCPTVMPLKMAPRTNIYPASHYFTVKPYLGTTRVAGTENEIDSCLAGALVIVKKGIANNEAIHEENKEAIENNIALHNKLTSIMQSVGIPYEYTTSAFKTTRSRTKTNTKHPAGYRGDLQRNIPVFDGCTSAIASFYSLEKGLETYAAKLRVEVKKKEIAKVLEEKNKKDVVVLATLRVKYKVSYDARLSELLDEVLDKCKYLDLAHALERNCISWNDGYAYAECGLNNFAVETEEDTRIATDISDCIDNWDGDGRVFRDTKWNYSVLYGKVEEELYKDFNLLREMLDD